MTALVPFAADRVPGPGFYETAAQVYHADPAPQPSLSASIAKLIIEKSPRHALLAHPRLSPAGPARNDEDDRMALGSVVHELLLGKGPGIQVVDADSWRTKAAQAERDRVLALGQTPILPHQLERAREMVASVRVAIAECEDDTRFALSDGHPEIMGVCQDAETGVWCRILMDWWMAGLTVIYDVKTSSSNIAPHAVGTLIENMGYDVSAAFYERVATTLLPELAGRLRYRFIFIEALPPYEVVFAEPTEEQMEVGRRKVAYALARFANCMATGIWPGYPRRLVYPTAPTWAIRQWAEREMSDPTLVIERRPALESCVPRLMEIAP